MANVSRNRTILPQSFMLMLCSLVRCTFIGHHGWNGWESTNQLQQHISHMKPCISCFIIWGRSVLYWSKDNPSFLPILSVFKNYSQFSPDWDANFLFLPILLVHREPCCLHFAQYTSVSPHSIDCKHTWSDDVKRFIAWTQPADWIPCDRSNIDLWFIWAKLSKNQLS